MAQAQESQPLADLAGFAQPSSVDRPGAVLRGASPLTWRRLLVRSDTSLTQFHCEYNYTAHREDSLAGHTRDGIAGSDHTGGKVRSRGTRMRFLRAVAVGYKERQTRRRERLASISGVVLTFPAGQRVREMRWRGTFFPGGSWRLRLPGPLGDILGVAALLSRASGESGSS